MDTSDSSVRVLLPGDIAATQQPDPNKVVKLRIGPGLTQRVVDDASQIVAVKSGVLRHRAHQQTYWLDSSHKRAVPSTGEKVIGIVLSKGGDNYVVDIGASLNATLPNLSFEGASKRNRPMLEIGALVYAKVTLANKDMEPELACTESSGAAQGLGPLVDGYMFACTTGLARRLLSSDSTILSALGRRFQFEVAVGMNGRVWVKSGTAQHTIIISNYISASEHMTATQIDAMLDDLWQTAR
eukprot:m.43577 g.43577  ORF g.43577 m.43577 type:complete len:241 (+) comp46750_c0_seq4:1-723(+)